MADGTAFKLGGGIRRKHKPLDPACPIHLRRICGVCRHFTGGMVKPGHCGLFEEYRHGLTGARNCEKWERR